MPQRSTASSGRSGGRCGAIPAREDWPCDRRALHERLVRWLLLTHTAGQRRCRHLVMVAGTAQSLGQLQRRWRIACSRWSSLPNAGARCAVGDEMRELEARPFTELPHQAYAEGVVVPHRPALAAEAQPR
jgi:hypothetical protein